MLTIPCFYSFNWNKGAPIQHHGGHVCSQPISKLSDVEVGGVELGGVELGGVAEEIQLFLFAKSIRFTTVRRIYEFSDKTDLMTLPASPGTTFITLGAGHPPSVLQQLAIINKATHKTRGELFT